MNYKFITLVAAGMFSVGYFTACQNKSAENAENQEVRTEESVAAAVATVEEGAPVETGENPAEVAEQTKEAQNEYGAAFFADSNKGKYKTTKSGLKYVMTKEGTGKSPKATDHVTVKYTGRLLNGTVFDSTDNNGGQPISFGLNQVIAGWTEGLQLMKEGGSMVIYIPSALAYGPNGTPGGPIGPNEDLIFTIDLVGVNK